MQGKFRVVPRKRPPKSLGVVADTRVAGRLSAVRRRISTLLFAGSVLIWIAAIGVYIRSRFRADAITWLTASHQCIFFESADGALSVTDQSPWPGPPQLRWSTGIPIYDIFKSLPDDTLRGPPIAWADSNSRTIRRYTWGHACVLYGTAWLNQRFSLDLQTRGWYFDSSPPEVHQLFVLGMSVPVWIPPLAFAVPPGFWLITAGRLRHRAKSRRHRGLCVRCGYDVRHTPLRCPECGDRVVDKHSFAGPPI